QYKCLGTSLAIVICPFPHVRLCVLSSPTRALTECVLYRTSGDRTTRCRGDIQVKGALWQIYYAG
ncbi:hypothetical protein GBAR_LOCUS8761, partial [Geodia barretti]